MMLNPRMIMFFLVGLGFAEARAEPNSPVDQAKPIFSTGVPHATRDKPQSKLWYAHGRWWAWLPVVGGSTILERTPEGWRELTDLRSSLTGFPGQADVFADEKTVLTVLVGGSRIAVVGLAYGTVKGTYELDSPVHEWAFPAMATPGAAALESRPPSIETATIVRDSRGIYWIAFAREGSIWVAATIDLTTRRWGSPQPLGSGLKPDDIGAVFAIGDRIGVIWSDQNADAVFFREHLDGQPVDRWNGRVTVDQGGKTADDHFNGAVAVDGTLFVATKNSVDQVGTAQLVLRVRRPDGTWGNLSYAPRTEEAEPSRPVAVLGGSPPRLFLLHTAYDRRKSTKPRQDIIRLRSLPTDCLDTLGKRDELILAAPTSLNDVSDSRSILPPGAPWIFLASDAQGNVYEGHLPQ